MYVTGHSEFQYEEKQNLCKFTRTVALCDLEIKKKDDV